MRGTFKQVSYYGDDTAKHRPAYKTYKTKNSEISTIACIISK